MVGWYHRLHGHEFEQALGDGGQGGQELQSMGWERVGQDLADRQQQDLISHV